MGILAGDFMGLGTLVLAFTVFYSNYLKIMIVISKFKIITGFN